MVEIHRNFTIYTICLAIKLNIWITDAQYSLRICGHVSHNSTK